MNLELRDGKFYYRPEKILFDKLNFDLGSGEILAIMGPNGVGKTSLIRCLCDFEKFKEGGASLDGVDIKTIDKKDLWSRLAYIPQKREASFAYKGIDMVVFGLANKIGPFASPSVSDYDKAVNLMKELGISHLVDKSCDRISGGELQMLIIARALIKEPDLLILDEAESGLDFRNQLKILSLIKDLSANKNMTVIFNTHYPNYALKIANKVLILRDDGKYFYGSRDIINVENIKKAFGVDAIIKDIKTSEGCEKILIPYKLS